MQKWEYCMLSWTDQHPAVHFFAADGYTKKEIHAKAQHELARAIAALGDEGWEMVGGTSDIIFFKRPKP